ncbi:MAG TPA: M14 family zinc carboxypeptidase [Candidatus Udaeobacter sp.]|nr:M14 family zinc carboxypeptidase [Candidatus Udaeobacter sp.]
MRARLIPLLFTLALGSIASGIPVAAGPLEQIRIRTEHPARLARELKSAGFDILEGSLTAASLDVVAGEGARRALLARGLELELVAVGRPFRELQAERLAAETEAGQVAGGVPQGYPSLAQIQATLAATAAAHPTICVVVDLTAELGVAPTIEGRHLTAIKISDQATQDEDEPAFLLVAAHHCREIVTPVIALHALDQLVNGYGVDPAITAAVNANEIWIAPVWNPDGYEYVFNVDNLWRKNRRVFPQGIGVDLNRNYPQGWSNPCSGSGDPSSETYKGPSPASEAETQTLIEWSLDLHPAKVLDYHSSGREVLHGYLCWSYPFDAYLAAEATQLAILSGYQGSHREPSADGEHYQFQFALGGGHAFLIETHSEFQPSYASAVAEAQQLWPGIKWLLEHPIPLWGHVRDAVSGEPVAAAISYPGITFPNGEENASFLPEGRYHAFLPAGTYSVRFEAEGYEPFVATGVQVTANSSTQLDAALTPSATAVAEGAAPNGAQPRVVVHGSLAAPTLEYSLRQPTAISLRLYGVRGDLVRTLVDADEHPGRHAVQWDGHDDRGRAVPAGGYYFVLATPAGTDRGKLLLAR